jgi:glycosyltransferase involved in cell wall biosynthesis
MTTIYNPVVDYRLVTMAQASPSHPWLLSRQVPVILAAGRLVPQKDFTTLIQAFARVRRERPARLLILGDGEQRDALLALAAECGVRDDVDLPGFDPNPFAAMRAASAFVLSSRYEGLPGVLIQAMACGARVVSTDCPSGPREVLEGGRWGTLVPVGDVAALATAVAATLDDPHPPDVRVRTAAFSEEQAVERYARVLGLR